MMKINLIAMGWLVAASIALQAQTTASRSNLFNLKNELAISGYDPVAYFTTQKGVEGNKSNAYTYQGVRYYFSSEANKNIFIKNPTAYEPQYGGWCAYAMGASGEKVEIDPETFKILNGKLYLFYHSWVNNTLTKWNSNETILKKNADVNWKKIFH